MPLRHYGFRLSRLRGDVQTPKVQSLADQCGERRCSAVTMRGLKSQLNEMMRKANRALVAARAHVKAGDYDFASSRAYYAAFYSMEAALLERGLVFSKHSGVMAGFAQNLIKTGVFPKDFSKRIARLFRERQIGDYEFDVTAFPPMPRRKTFGTQQLSFVR